MLTRNHLLLVFLLLGSPTLFAAETQPVRWAILATPELGDLLTVELSKRQDIELVERAEIDKVMRELEISAMFGEESIGKRLELGKILKADRLLVLKNDSPGDSLEIFILDTEFGLMLFNSKITPQKTNDEHLCAGIAAIASQVNRRYQNGIHAVIAVSYFVSRSFDRSFDHLQEDYAKMIGNALLQQDGIAVVALEELSLIQKELSLHSQRIDDHIGRRIVPLHITGTYSILTGDNATQTSSPSVSLSIEIRDMADVIHAIEKDRIALQDAVTLMGVVIPEEIFRILDSPSLKPLPLELQKQQWLREADLLNAVGANELAIRCREAAFLIDPDDAEKTLRLLLGVEHRQGAISDRYRALPYLEHLLEHGKLNLIQGLQVVIGVMINTQGPIRFDYAGKPINDTPDPLRISDNVDFLYHLAPLIVKLPLAETQEECDLPIKYCYRKDVLIGARHIPELQYDLFSIMIEGKAACPICDSSAGHRDLNLWTAKYSTKEYLDKIFQMQRTIPRYVFFNIISYQMPEFWKRLSREGLTYYCDLWRNTNDPYDRLYTEAVELHWAFYNQSELEPNEWENKYVPKFRTIFREYWKQDSATTYVPKNPGAAGILSRIRYLEHEARLTNAGFTSNANVISGAITEWYPLSPMITLREPNLPRSTTSFKKDLMDFYISAPSKPAIRRKLKNDYFSFQQISDWGVPVTARGMLRQELPSKAERERQFDEGLQKKNSFTGAYDHITPLFDVENGALYLEKLNDSTDIVWDHVRVFRITKNKTGQLQYDRLISCLAPGEQKLIHSVQCAVNHIWVSSTEGVDVLSQEGKQLAHFDLSQWQPPKEGHSPFDDSNAPITTFPRGNGKDYYHGTQMNRDMRECWNEDIRSQGGQSIIPVSASEALVIGVSGPLRQTWMVKLTYDANTGATNAKFLHGTTRHLPPDDYLKEDDLNAGEQMDVIFSFPWVCRFPDSKHPERRQILVARKFGEALFATPLLVDLDSEEVMLLTDRYPDLSPFKAAVAVQCVNDCFVVRRGHYTIDVIARNAEGRYHLTQITEERKETYPDTSSKEQGTHQDCFLFTYGGQVYSPGANWWRIDLRMAEPRWHIIAARDDTIPTFMEMRNYAPSAHFGIWCQPERGLPYRVDFSPIDMEINPGKDRVPNDRLAQHEAAAKRIAELGGSVYFGEPYRRVFFLDGKWQYGFGVRITDQWKGTSDDFALFGDIDRLTAVEIVDAPVDDAALEHLVNIPTICELFLIRTNVTEKGLMQFPLKRLTRLFLEDTPDIILLTDRVLEAVMDSQNLKVLGFSGMGFTDRAYNIVKMMPDIRNVTVHYAEMSDDILKKINMDFRFDDQYGSKRPKPTMSQR